MTFLPVTTANCNHVVLQELHSSTAIERFVPDLTSVSSP